LAVDEGRSSQAVPLLQQALTTDPGNAAAKTLLAALRVDPSGSSGVATNSFASQWSLGNALYERGKLDEAEKAYRAALELDPRNADGWNKLGIVLQKESRRPEARAAYTRALDASPDHADALFNRAKLELLENELPDARRDVDRLLATHKDYAAASFLEAHVCVAEGNTAGAKAALAKFVALPNADARMKTVATDMLQKLGG
jgi:tetratricopeptide (TPR) repeat protein